MLAHKKTVVIILLIVYLQLTMFILHKLGKLTVSGGDVNVILSPEDTNNDHVKIDYVSLQLKTRLALAESPLGQVITSPESAEMEAEEEEEDVCTLQLTFQLLHLTNYPLKAESSPFLIASFCQLNHSPEQLFIVIVEQVEVMDESEAEEEGEKLQVFFSFCNQKYPHKCVVVHKIAYSGTFFLMKPCTGEVNQLFYLDVVDYNEETAAFKNS